MGINDDPWSLALLDDGAMDGFTPVWDCHEKFLYATLELESLRASAKEEIRRKDDELRRKEEESNKLIQLLKIITQERDAARDELQMLVNKILQQQQQQPPNAVDIFPIITTPVQIESPSQMRLTRGSSSITDSDSPSETHNHHHSFVSSPLTNMADSFYTGIPHPLLCAEPKTSTSGLMGFSSSIDRFDRLAMQKALPEKGKLLQAVQAVNRATPLLKTLLLTGSLPEWRNPPPLATQVFFQSATVRPASSLVQRDVNGFHHESSTVKRLRTR